MSKLKLYDKKKVSLQLHSFLVCDADSKYVDDCSIELSLGYNLEEATETLFKDLKLEEKKYDVYPRGYIKLDKILKTVEIPEEKVTFKIEDAVPKLVSKKEAMKAMKYIDINYKLNKGEQEVFKKLIKKIKE